MFEIQSHFFFLEWKSLSYFGPTLNCLYCGCLSELVKIIFILRSHGNTVEKPEQMSFKHLLNFISSKWNWMEVKSSLICCYTILFYTGGHQNSALSLPFSFSASISRTQTYARRIDALIYSFFLCSKFLFYIIYLELGLLILMRLFYHRLRSYFDRFANWAIHWKTFQPVCGGTRLKGCCT